MWWNPKQRKWMVLPESVVPYSVCRRAQLTWADLQTAAAGLDLTGTTLRTSSWYAQWNSWQGSTSWRLWNVNIEQQRLQWNGVQIQLSDLQTYPTFLWFQQKHVFYKICEQNLKKWKCDLIVISSGAAILVTKPCTNSFTVHIKTICKEECVIA